jgi:hypothetical protein
MLVIRSAQMKALSETLQRDFELRLRRDVERLLAEAGVQVGSKEVEVQVQHGMTEARTWGLKTERDVARFLRIRCVHLREIAGGPLPPKAAAILSSYHATAQEKLEDLESWVTRYCRRRAGRSQ